MRVASLADTGTANDPSDTPKEDQLELST